MAANKITLVYAYYNNGDMLDQHLAEWSLYPRAAKKHLRAVIVDDASPIKPAIDRVFNVGFPVEVFRVQGDVPWHQDAARNLGMTRPGGWTLLCDMDRLLPWQAVEPMLDMTLEKGKAYLPLQRRLDGTEPKSKLGRHPNIYLLHRDDFWAAGGYDERLCGWYGTDSNFRRRLAQVVEFVHIENVWLTYYRLTDTLDAGTRGAYRDPKYQMRNAPADIQALARSTEKPPKGLKFAWERLC